MLVTFGNGSLIAKVEHPDLDVRELVTVHYDHVERTESTIDLPTHWRPESDPATLADWDNDESFRTIVNKASGFVSMHMEDKPLWVECAEWPALETALRAWYGIGGRPSDWSLAIDSVPRLRLDVPEAAPAVAVDALPKLTGDEAVVEALNAPAPPEPAPVPDPEPAPSPAPDAPAPDSSAAPVVPEGEA